MFLENDLTSLNKEVRSFGESFRGNRTETL